LESEQVEAVELVLEHLSQAEVAVVAEVVQLQLPAVEQESDTGSQVEIEPVVEVAD
jgi:primosomal replication protein N